MDMDNYRLIDINQKLTWLERLCYKFLTLRHKIKTKAQTEAYHRYIFSAGGYFGATQKHPESAWNNFKRNNKWKYS